MLSFHQRCLNVGHVVCSRKAAFSREQQIYVLLEALTLKICKWAPYYEGRRSQAVSRSHTVWHQLIA